LGKFLVMPISPNFTASQNSGTPNIITLTDTSTGSDGTISKRRVYLLQSDGTYLVPAGTSTSFIEWNLADVSISLNVLTQDSALSITVQWLTSANTVVANKTTSFAFTAYNETFYYGLTESQVANANLTASTNWYQTKMILRVELDSAYQAISFASDIFSAQSALNRATFISTNSSFFF
jgi:hypothetical protein